MPIGDRQLQSINSYLCPEYSPVELPSPTSFAAIKINGRKTHGAQGLSIPSQRAPRHTFRRPRLQVALSSYSNRESEDRENLTHRQVHADENSPKH